MADEDSNLTQFLAELGKWNDYCNRRGEDETISMPQELWDQWDHVSEALAGHGRRTVLEGFNWWLRGVNRVATPVFMDGTGKTGPYLLAEAIARGRDYEAVADLMTWGLVDLLARALKIREPHVITYLLAIVLELTSNSALREVWRANDIRKMAKPIVQVCFFGPTTAHYAADAWVALSRLVYESAELSRYAWLSLDLPTCIHHRMANMEERLQYLSKKRGDVELAHIARIICAMCDLLTETLSTTEVVTKQMMAFLITAGGDERLVLSCGEDVIKFARTYSWLSPSRTRRIFRLEILATIESYLAHRRDLQEEPFAADLILPVVAILFSMSIVYIDYPHWVLIRQQIAMAPLAGAVMNRFRVADPDRPLRNENKDACSRARLFACFTNYLLDVDHPHPPGEAGEVGAAINLIRNGRPPWDDAILSILHLDKQSMLNMIRSTSGVERKAFANFLCYSRPRHFVFKANAAPKATTTHTEMTDALAGDGEDAPAPATAATVESDDAVGGAGADGSPDVVAAGSVAQNGPTTGAGEAVTVHLSQGRSDDGAGSDDAGGAAASGVAAGKAGAAAVADPGGTAVAEGEAGAAGEPTPRRSARLRSTTATPGGSDGDGDEEGNGDGDGDGDGDDQPLRRSSRTRKESERKRTSSASGRPASKRRKRVGR